MQILSIPLLLFLVIIATGCKPRYPTSLEDCPWEASFPDKPEITTLFDGNVVRKQRAQVKNDNELYRISCTLWKKQPRGKASEQNTIPIKKQWGMPSTKESDERWVQRVTRAMNLTITDQYKQSFPQHSLTKLMGKGPDNHHYWLDSYFDGKTRFALIYRQPTAKLLPAGRDFLASIKKKPISKAALKPPAVDSVQTAIPVPPPPP